MNIPKLDPVLAMAYETKRDLDETRKSLLKSVLSGQQRKHNSVHNASAHCSTGRTPHISTHTLCRDGIWPTQNMLEIHLNMSDLVSNSSPRVVFSSKKLSSEGYQT